MFYSVKSLSFLKLLINSFRLPQTFHYLNTSGCVSLDDLDEKTEFKDTQTAMTMVGLKAKAQEAIFKMVAGVLHLGNVDFAEEGQVGGVCCLLSCHYSVCVCVCVCVCVFAY